LPGVASINCALMSAADYLNASKQSLAGDGLNRQFTREIYNELIHRIKLDKSVR
jgi:hypothetical protein